MQKLLITVCLTGQAVSLRNVALIILALVLAGAPQASFAQGTFAAVRLNNYDSGKGIFAGLSEGPLTAAPAGTFVQLLAGPNLNSLQPVKSEDSRFGTVFTIGPEGVNAQGPGTGSFFDAGYGFVPGVAPNAVATFQLRAWLNSPTYDAAAYRGFVAWIQTTGEAPPSLNAAPLQMPVRVIIFIPEPSTVLLGVLGAAFVLLRAHIRRRGGRGQATGAY